MLREMKRERDFLRKMLNEMEGKLQKLPQGTLRCTQSKNITQYYVNGSYLKKEQQRKAAEICERQYYEPLCKEIEKILEKWEALIYTYEKNQLDASYEKLCGARKVLLKEAVYKTKSQMIQDFMEEVYPSGSFEENDEKEIFTIKGERVRSKSEKIIADELFRRGIPYKYEKPLVLEDRGRKITFRPDFTILNVPQRKRYILEHLGMMDDPAYVAGAMRKLNIYEKNNYLLGRDLILLRESSENPLNIKILQNYIEEYFVD